MVDFVKKLLSRIRRVDKKTYAEEITDWTVIGYGVFFISLFIFFIITVIVNKKFALPYLLLFPSLMGVFVILFMLPVRGISFLITEIVLRVLLFHTPKNIPAETVIVIGKNEYLKPSFWIAPNYDTGLLTMVNYLRMRGKPFSIYYEASRKTLDDIMADEKIRTVLLVGHGRRHGFGIDKSTVVDYCSYSSPKYRKDFVYQIHCNQGKGTSLVEYVVPKENQQDCIPEHGYMTNLSINRMFVDKIIEFKQLTGIKAYLTKAGYTTIIMIIPMTVLLGWGYIFFRMVT